MSLRDHVSFASSLSVFSGVRYFVSPTHCNVSLVIVTMEVYPLVYTISGKEKELITIIEGHELLTL